MKKMMTDKMQKINGGANLGTPTKLPTVKHYNIGGGNGNWIKHSAGGGTWGGVLEAGLKMFGEDIKAYK